MPERTLALWLHLFRRMHLFVHEYACNNFPSNAHQDYSTRVIAILEIPLNFEKMNYTHLFENLCNVFMLPDYTRKSMHNFCYLFRPGFEGLWRYAIRNRGRTVYYGDHHSMYFNKARHSFEIVSKEEQSLQYQQ